MVVIRSSRKVKVENSNKNWVIYVLNFLKEFIVWLFVLGERAKRLEAVLVQKDQKLRQQDQIIQALSKKLNLTETELAAKNELASEYEERFVQVREAVDSEKFRFET